MTPDKEDERIKWLNSGDSPHINGPYRIVELYTKEQLEQAIKNERRLCQKICDDAVECYLAVSMRKVAGCIEDISARIGDRSVGESAHGIVEPSSLEQSKEE